LVDKILSNYLSSQNIKLDDTKKVIKKKKN